MFLLPYSLSYNYLGFHGYLIFLLFFTILVLGFLVEWSIGMLVWRGEENSPAYFSKNSNKEKNFSKKLTTYLYFLKLYL